MIHAENEERSSPSTLGVGMVRTDGPVISRVGGHRATDLLLSMSLTPLSARWLMPQVVVRA